MGWLLEAKSGGFRIYSRILRSKLWDLGFEGLGFRVYANGHADCREARHLTTKRGFRV